MAEIDWEQIRNTRYSEKSAPKEWSKNVRPISMEGLVLLGIDPTSNKLYWDGKELQIVQRLDWPERLFAAFVALSGLVLAGIEVGRVAGWLSR